jgi:hypothetical protein
MRRIVAGTPRKTTMPIRFSTEAANADFLGEDPEPGSATNGAATATGDGSGKRERQRDRPFTRSAGSGEVKPGKDINAPGFIKDKDAGKP